MTLLRTRKLRAAQRAYRAAVLEHQVTAAACAERMNAAGCKPWRGMTHDEKIEYCMIYERISRETGHAAATQALVAAEWAMLDAAKAVCESAGFAQYAIRCGVPPTELERVFRDGPRSVNIRPKLLQICLNL